MFLVIIRNSSVRYFTTRQGASDYASRMMRLHGASNVVYNFTRLPGWKNHEIRSQERTFIPASDRMGLAL